MGGAVVKNPPANAGDTQETWGESLSQEDPPGGGSGNLLQYSCLGNPMDRGAWWAIVHRVTKSQTRLSTEHLHIFFQVGKPNSKAKS